MTESKKRSLVDERRETLEGRLGIEAAKLGHRIAGLLNRARDASGVKNSQIAERLGISEGRVSQVLNGDGNLHSATVARFLAACDYELEVSARPVRDDLPVLESHRRPRKRPSAAIPTAAAKWDFFEQVFASPAGVTYQVSAVERPDGAAECPVPIGMPTHLGTSPAHRYAPSRAMRFDAVFGVDDWFAGVAEALEAEESAIGEVGVK